MLKLNYSTDFEDGSISLLETTGSSLEKKAACSAISEFLTTLKPKPGRIYIHVNMLGSSETYGQTRNGDIFPEEALKKYHKTFETNPAKLFKHHHNKNGAKEYGVVLFSTFNDVMKRIELIVEVNEETSIELEQQIKQGKYPKTSMACRLPYDTCSICGNQARTRQEYCAHLSREMGKIYPDGRRVGAINDNNISWFDCSLVLIPADVTSSVLMKVAEDTVMGSAELAELEGITDPFEKQTEFKKISELVKEISEGEVLNAHGIEDQVLSKTQDLPLDLAPTLAGFDTAEVLQEMARLGISPSLSFLSEMIAIRHLGLRFQGIGPVVEAIAHESHEDATTPVVKFTPPEHPSGKVNSLLSPFIKTSSLFPEYIEKRSSEVGSFGLGPHIEPLPWEQQQQAVQGLGITEPKVEGFVEKYGKLLFGLAGASLMAKWYISNEMNKRLDQTKNGVKIVIIKKASDYSTASHFSKVPVVQMNNYRQSKKEDGYSGFSLQRLATKITNRILRRVSPRDAAKVSNVLKLGNVVAAQL